MQLTQIEGCVGRGIPNAVGFACGSIESRKGELSLGASLPNSGAVSLSLEAGGSSGVEDTAGREPSAFGVVVAEPVLFASFGAGVAAGASTPVVVPAAASL